MRLQKAVWTVWLLFPIPYLAETWAFPQMPRPACWCLSSGHTCGQKARASVTVPQGQLFVQALASSRGQVRNLSRRGSPWKQSRKDQRCSPHLREVSGRSFQLFTCYQPVPGCPLCGGGWLQGSQKENFHTLLTCFPPTRTAALPLWATFSHENRRGSLVSR